MGRLGETVGGLRPGELCVWVQEEGGASEENRAASAKWLGQQLFSYWIIVLLSLNKGKVTILFTSKRVKMLVKDDHRDFSLHTQYINMRMSEQLNPGFC